jgi:nucleolar pre-ribosomal-associated protein 1
MRYKRTQIPAIHNAIEDLLHHILSPTALFTHDPHETYLWLDALPYHTANVAGTFGDELEHVVAFVDECVQRCVKTPHRYVEQVDSLSSSSSLNHSPQQEEEDDDDDSKRPSPLLITLIEQLNPKITSSPSTQHILALISFIRRLVFKLVGKVASLGVLRWVVESVRRVVAEWLRGDKGDDEVCEAVRWEMGLMDEGLRRIVESGSVGSPGLIDIELGIEEILENVENRTFVYCFCIHH